MTPSDATILVVEDDENDLFLLKRAFAKAKVTNPIQEARDGEEAVGYLTQILQGSGDGARLPVLVLLDLKLPRLSGHEVLSWIRSQNATRRLPVVVLTSSDEPRDINMAYDAGANSYLVKPGDPTRILELALSVGTYWLMTNQPPITQ